MTTTPGARLCTALGALLLGVGAGVGVARAQPAEGTAPTARTAPTAAPPRAKKPPVKSARPPARQTARSARPVPRRVAPQPTPATPATPRAEGKPAPCHCPPPPRGARRSGLALQLALGTSAQVYASTLATAAHPGMSGRFQLGYRYRRVTFGLGLEFVRTESKDLAGEERNAHLVLFRPTLEVDLWQPWPLSLYLTVGVHGGFLGTEGRNVVDDELPAVGFHGGLGVRYFLHPRFALGMEGGFQGVWLVDDDGDDTVDGTVMFYGAIVLLAIL